MTREETIRKTLDTVLWTRSASDDNKNILTDALIEALEQEPTTKNDLAGDIIEFPKTFDEFAEDYGFTDKDEVYTNGSELIPVFRVKQWLEHISSTTPQELRKGKWIIYLSTAIEDFYQCSECGRMVYVKQTDSIKNYPYCHCGADMRGEEE